MRGVDTGLADPADLQRNQRAEKLLGRLHVRRDVVVDEEEKRLLDAADLLDDLVHRTPRLRGPEVRRDGAEFAAEVAASPGLDQSDGQVALAGEDGPVRAQAAQRRTFGLLVHTAEASIAEIVQHRG